MMLPNDYDFAGVETSPNQKMTLLDVFIGLGGRSLIDQQKNRCCTSHGADLSSETTTSGDGNHPQSVLFRLDYSPELENHLKSCLTGELLSL